MVTVLGFFLILSSNFAFGSAPDFTIHAKMGPKQIEYSATAPAKHHFNLQAPMGLIAESQFISKKPNSATEKELIFVVDVNTAKGLTAISAYLCDDAKTFCEKHTVPLSQRNPSSGLKIDHHGFIDNQPDQAFSQALRKSQPLLIDFYGIWCPPCNELDEEVFSQKEFQKKTSAFTKLKMDSDSQLSWNLKSRYKIGGYPTLVFTTPQGDEILRVVGFRTQEELIKKANEAYALRDISFESLKKKADSGDQDSADRIGRIYSDRTDWENAVHYLNPSKKCRENFLEVQMELTRARKKSDPETAIAYENYLKEFPQSPDSLNARDRLQNIYEDLKQPEKKQATLEALVLAAQFLESHLESLKNYDMTEADVYSAQAEAYENLENDALSKKAWANAVAEYRKKKLSLHERGYNLELAYALAKSGNSKASHQLYENLETHYPNEFTFHFAHARLLLTEKQFTPAEVHAQKALEFAYGDNKLRAVQLLAKVYQSESKNADAKSLIDKTIQEAAAPNDQEIRTHRYLDALRDLKKTL